jgi:hypothetical protein
MINVARVPAEQFEKLVEREKPATISQLALLGTKQRVKPPPFRNEYVDWTRAVRQLERFRNAGSRTCRHSIHIAFAIYVRSVRRRSST